MEIILAGCNLDYDAIMALKKGLTGEKSLTPETIAAAYARISRDPRPVNELRKISMEDVAKARQSNRNIVFAMGHSSIAEHAMFNIDVLGISRLLAEEIEKSRLVSYTEKSQRYVLLKDDFVVPEEIKDGKLESDFISLIVEQNQFYHKLYESLRIHLFEKHKDMADNPANRSLLEGRAKEDARYIISLATKTQLGMTINARSLEHMIRRLASSSLPEAQEASRILYEAAFNIAPSLIRYAEQTDYERLTRNELKEKLDSVRSRLRDFEANGQKGISADYEDVTVIHASADADDRLISALLHSSSELSMGQCIEIVKQMTAEEKEAAVKKTYRHMQSYDAVLREFEYIDLNFELIISATCFAQLKRHRMATITCQDYNPGLGTTVPPVVSEAGMETAFLKVIARTNETYDKLKKAFPASAAYVLTNAHRRRVSIKVNARELYHISRLRGGRHAQWDIRQIAIKMTELGRKIMPLTLMLAVGKDDFKSLYETTQNV